MTSGITFFKQLVSPELHLGKSFAVILNEMSVNIWEALLHPLTRNTNDI